MSENDEITESCEICPMFKPKNILMVVTQNEMGTWLEEFAIPYNAFVEKGYSVTVATPNGGIAPIALESDKESEENAKRALNDTFPLDSIDFMTFDALVLPGGHGPMFDLCKNETLANIIEDFSKREKLIAAICHGPAGLLSAKVDGIPFVNGKTLTAFTNEEEIYAKKESLIPFFLEDALKDLGCNFVQGSIGAVNVVEDKNLITAQNYQSAKNFTEAILKHLEDN